MTKISILFFLFFFTLETSAQAFLSHTAFNLGEVSRLNQDVMDLNIANISNEDIYLLRIDAPNPVSVKFSSKLIKAGEAEIVRIKLNPKKETTVQEIIQLYFSNNQQPTEIKLRADVRQIPKNDRQACPSFRREDLAQKSMEAFQNQPASQIQRFYVQVNDEEFSQEEIAEIQAFHEQKRTEVEEKKAIAALPSMEKQRQAQKQTNKDNSRKEVKKEKNRKSPEERRNSPSLGEILFGKEEEVVKKEETNQSKEKNEQTEMKINSPDEVKEAETEPSEKNNSLLGDNFKANNIVFLIDASTSMTKEKRMNLLKNSMIHLLNAFREIDYLSIVVYSGEARVLLQPTSGINKAYIRNMIDSIVAEGSTQAVKGIEKAIKVGQSSFIENGNNQIILATDGDFDIGSRNESLRAKIEKTANEGLTITALGMNNDFQTRKTLKEISDLGNGEYIRIKNFRQVDLLLDHIKSNSIY